MKVYDSFLFLNEIDLLEIRLNELNDVVDYFIITEGNKTFSGLYKDFTLETKYKERLEKFWDKIIYLKADVNQYPGNNPWRKESFQRNLFTRQEIGIEGKDIVVVSDVDEIPSKQQLIESVDIVKKGHGAISLFVDFCFYYLNNKCVDKPHWLGPVVAERDSFGGSQQLRENRNQYGKSLGKKIGWHFTYCSKEEKEIEKVKSYSHFKEYADLTQEDIERSVIEGRSFFDKERFFQKNNNNLPNYVLKNKRKFKDLLIHEEKKFLWFNRISL